MRHALPPFLPIAKTAVGSRMKPWLVASTALACVALSAGRAEAEVAEPAGRADNAFDFMNFLSQHGLHDLDDESWNAYGQMTDIWAQKFRFHPKVVGGPFSLASSPELSFTETATIWVGFRLWPGAEAYFVPELIGERAFENGGNQLKGLGSVIQDFELQKTGSTVPSPYLARSYIQQTINLGGAETVQKSDPGHVASKYTSRRIMLYAGNFAVNDFFDKNSVAGDLRRSFTNMAFLTYAAFDFAADARGYSWGGVAELYYDDWEFRFGRVAVPKLPNQLPLDFHLDRYYGDQAEVTHNHSILGRTGAVRLIGYRNRELMGRFTDAINVYGTNHADNAANCGNLFNYGNTAADAPDLCYVRGKPNIKVGIGAAVEQQIAEDLSVFGRFMYSDGQTEVYSYTSTDRSLSFGAVANGERWHRDLDNVGVAWGEGWISKVHAQYLGMGGVDGFIGDGSIHQSFEGVLEGYYRYSLGSSAWLTADYQHIWNPAYNSDRGQVNIFGGRVHVEF